MQLEGGSAGALKRVDFFSINGGLRWSRVAATIVFVKLLYKNRHDLPFDIIIEAGNRVVADTGQKSNAFAVLIRQLADRTALLSTEKTHN
jgi:hypothetical protein